MRVSGTRNAEEGGKVHQHPLICIAYSRIERGQPLDVRRQPVHEFPEVGALLLIAVDSGRAGCERSRRRLRRLPDVRRAACCLGTGWWSHAAQDSVPFSPLPCATGVDVTGRKSPYRCVAHLERTGRWGSGAEVPHDGEARCREKADSADRFADSEVAEGNEQGRKNGEREADAGGEGEGGRDRVWHMGRVERPGDARTMDARRGFRLLASFNFSEFFRSSCLNKAWSSE
ncbi:hypothetical protein DFH09DRAFT_1077353 [Mycena vulgaris]|nr:hypothetical protein DFH09DRAFT_1077353 [Mycena vulgaris]